MIASRTAQMFLRFTLVLRWRPDGDSWRLSKQRQATVLVIAAAANARENLMTAWPSPNQQASTAKPAWMA